MEAVEFGPLPRTDDARSRAAKEQSPEESLVDKNSTSKKTRAKTSTLEWAFCFTSARRRAVVQNGHEFAVGAEPDESRPGGRADAGSASGRWPTRKSARRS